VLGQDRASAVLAECAGAVERFAQPGFTAQAGEFEDVAKKLSALGFFVTQLQGGAADIDTILAPPPTVAKPVREAREPVAVAAVVAEPTAIAETPGPAPADAIATAPAIPEVTAAEPAPEVPIEIEPADDSALPNFEVEGFAAPAEPEPPPAPPPIEAPAPSAEAERLLDASEEDLDAELLGIFLEEAKEVMGTINQNLPTLQAAPSDHEALVTVRRSFHTLKGSGRMVGLAELGDAGWSVEQVLNAWLHDTKPASPALLEMLDLAASVFGGWVAQLEGGGSRHYDYALLAKQCAVLSGAEEEAPVAVAPAPTPEPVAEPVVADVPTTEPEIAAPELVAPEVAQPEAAEPAAVTPEAELPEAPSIELPALEIPTPEPSVPELPPLDVVPEAAAEVVEAIAEISAPPSAEVVAFPSPPPVRVGEVEIAPTLYNLYLDETREHVATLQANLGAECMPGNDVIRAAHTTASISAATGILPISTLARALEDALGRLMPDRRDADGSATLCLRPLRRRARRHARRRCPAPHAGRGNRTHRRAAGDEPGHRAGDRAPVAAIADASVATPSDARDARDARGGTPAGRRRSASAAGGHDHRRRASRGADGRRDRPADPPALPRRKRRADARDRRDPAPVARIDPTSGDIARSLQRALHTLKGSARMAGAMGCGELLHSMEDRIDQAVRMKSVQPAVIDGLETSYDRAEMLIERLRNPNAAPVERDEAKPQAEAASVAVETAAEAAQSFAEAAPATHAHAAATTGKAAAGPAAFVPAAQVHLRVRADLVDQLVNEAGEVAIARGRIEGELLALKSSMLDLTENVIRLRKQLREVEIQAESQMQSQQALASERAQAFDPLEFDRFTRFQEVTRMMAESVNDVATVQQNLMRTLDHANAAVTAQARLSRELSQRLMGVRMVPFESIAERLHRVVRQAAKDTGKRANLDIRHGQTELDRSVLDKMAGPLEHMLRNSVAHGLESTAGRSCGGQGSDRPDHPVAGPGGQRNRGRDQRRRRRPEPRKDSPSRHRPRPA
jgi:chemosensory pili system protein ChpA (sensor histidine kinase/response regulator)